MLTTQQSTLPFELMYGRPPQQTPFEQLHSFDVDSYQHHLQAKLAEMRDFVETNLAESASRQDPITINTCKAESMQRGIMCGCLFTQPRN